MHAVELFRELRFVSSELFYRRPPQQFLSFPLLQRRADAAQPHVEGARSLQRRVPPLVQLGFGDIDLGLDRVHVVVERDPLRARVSPRSAG